MRSARTGGTRLVCLLIVVITLNAGLGGQTSGAWHKFVSNKGGYVAWYPPGWHIIPPSPPTLDVDNFPASWLGGGVYPPKGGADIAVVPPSEGVSTVAQWIVHDSRLWALLSERHSRLERLNSKEVMPVTEVMWGSYDAATPILEIVIYFQLSTGILAARLAYWKGDPKAAQYPATLRAVVERIVPIPPGATAPKPGEISPSGIASSEARAQAAVTPSVPPVSQWLTFSSRSGWEIRYPPGWEVASCQQCSDPAAAGNYVSFYDPAEGESVMIEPWTVKPADEEADKWLDEIKTKADANPVLTEERMTVDGHPALMVRYRHADSTEGEAVYVVASSATFEISDIDIANKSFYELYRQMLSTFRLTR